MRANNQSITVEDILSSVNPIEEIKKLNAQIYPAKFRVDTNDKFSKSIFNLTPEKYAELMNGGYRNIVEKKNHKKHGKIRSPFKVYNGNGYINTEPLTEFDHAVLDVCISNWLAGNRYITPAMIYRALTGKVHDKSDVRPSKDQYAEIMKSINKLMGTVVSSDMTDVCEKLKYNDGTPFKFVSAILPACYIEATINGQDATVIFFDRESPLLQVATIKKQLLTYDADLLDVPNQNNTWLIIALKNYILRRIHEVILHGMTATLTLDDIFEKVRIKSKSNTVKLRAREYIENFFEHLKNVGLIDSFYWNKKGNRVYSISFRYTKKAKPAPAETSTDTNKEIPSNSNQDSQKNTETSSISKETLIPPDTPAKRFSRFCPAKDDEKAKPKNDIEKVA